MKQKKSKSLDWENIYLIKFFYPEYTLKKITFKMQKANQQKWGKCLNTYFVSVDVLNHKCSLAKVFNIIGEMQSKPQ